MSIYYTSIMLSLWFISAGVWYDKNKFISSLGLIAGIGYNIIYSSFH